MFIRGYRCLKVLHEVLMYTFSFVVCLALGYKFEPLALMDGAGELDIEDLGREKWSPSTDESLLEKSDKLVSKADFKVTAELTTKPGDRAVSKPLIPSTPLTHKPTTTAVSKSVTPLLADIAQPIEDEMNPLSWKEQLELLQGSSAPKKSFESPKITGANVTMVEKQQPFRPVSAEQSLRPVHDWKSHLSVLKQNQSSSRLEITKQFTKPVPSITQSPIRTEAKCTQELNSKPFQKPAAITKRNQFAEDINFSNPWGYDLAKLQCKGIPDKPSEQSQQPVAAVTTTTSPMDLFKKQLQQIKNDEKSERLKKTQPAPNPYVWKRDAGVAGTNNSREPSHLRKDERGVNTTPVFGKQPPPRPQQQKPNNWSGHPPPQSPMFNQQRPKGENLSALGGSRRPLSQANEHKNNWQSSEPEALPWEKDERQLQESQRHHQNVLPVPKKGILKKPLIAKSDDANCTSQSRNVGVPAGRGWNAGVPAGRGWNAGVPAGRGSNAGVPAGRGSNAGVPAGWGSNAGVPAGRGWNGANKSPSGWNARNREHEQHVQPWSKVQHQQPGSKVQHDQPGSKVQHDQHGSKVQHDQPGSKVQHDQPGSKVQHDQSFSKVQHDQSWSKIQHNQSWSKDQHDQSWSKDQHDQSWSKDQHDQSWSKDQHDQSWSKDQHDQSWSKDQHGQSWSKDQHDQSWSKDYLGQSWAKGQHDQPLSKGQNDQSWSKGQHDQSWSKGQRDQSWSEGQHDQSWSEGQHDQSWSKAQQDQSWSKGQHDQSLSKGQQDRTWSAVESENRNFPPPPDNFNRRPDHSANPDAPSENKNQTSGILYCPRSGPVGTSKEASELAPRHFPPPTPDYSSTKWSLFHSNTKDESDGVMPSNHTDQTMNNIYTGSNASDYKTHNSYERPPTNNSVTSGGTRYSGAPYGLPPERANVQPTSQSFDADEAYRTLERLVPSLDILGPALNALILVARQRGSTTPHALKLFVDPEHINLMNLCLVNFEELTRTSSSSQGMLLREGVALGRKLLEFATHHGGDHVTTPKRTDTLDTKAIATATIGQSQEAIIMFIRNAAAYKGLGNLTNDELSDVYLKVQDLQKTLRQTAASKINLMNDAMLSAMMR